MPFNVSPMHEIFFEKQAEFFSFSFLAVSIAPAGDAKEIFQTTKSGSTIAFNLIYSTIFLQNECNI